MWALLIVNLFKYPFFQYGPRYATATGESLIDGYKKVGKWVLIIYFLLTFLTMFTIQAAVTIVTAGLAANLFGITSDLTIWSIIITAISFSILLLGKYKLLDNLMKIIIVTLAISSIIAVFVAIFKNDTSYNFIQILPKGTLEISFLIAFLGWMPAPLDISAWHSLWTIEKIKDKSHRIIRHRSPDRRYNINKIRQLCLFYRYFDIYIKCLSWTTVDAVGNTANHHVIDGL